MGEDALRLLQDYRHRYAAIRAHVKQELPLIRGTAARAKGRVI